LFWEAHFKKVYIKAKWSDPM